MKYYLAFCAGYLVGWFWRGAYERAVPVTRGPSMWYEPDATRRQQ